MVIEKNGLKIDFDETTGKAEFTLLRNGVKFVQEEANTRVFCVEKLDDGIAFKVTLDGVEFLCVYRIKWDETGKYVAFSLATDTDFDGYINYPAPFVVKKGDKLIEAYGEGFAFNVEDEIDFPPERLLFGGCWNSMSFYTLESGKNWLMTAVIDNSYAYLMTERNLDGLYCTHVRWETEMGRWGKSRELRYYLGQGNAIVDSAMQYRKVARQKGLVRSFAEKADENKNIERLIGCANVWLWNNDSMDKLYSTKREYVPTTKEQFDERRRVAQEMKSRGMKDVLWSMFDENIDAEEIDFVKSLGYLTTYYDVYTDVIPGYYAKKLTGTRRKRCENRVKYWPDGIIVCKDGTRMPAWELKGWDGNMYPQERMCDIPALECALENVQKHGVKNGIDGVFVDVSFGCTLECYHKDHLQTRTQGIATKNEMLKKIRETGRFIGAENPHEDAVKYCDYSEGLLSYAGCRLPDAGRRMTTLYNESELSADFEKYMLNPKYRIPLWELVYHDCMTAYWYWGDSTNSVPALMKKRNLFELLYGLPSLFSFSVETWDERKEEIVAAYQVATPNAKKLAGVRMTNFEYLTDDKTVQKTTFANATQIIVNFGNEAYRYENKKILPMSARVL